MRSRYQSALEEETALVDDSFFTMTINGLKYFRQITNRLVRGRRIRQTQVVLSPEPQASQAMDSTIYIVNSLTHGIARIEPSRRLSNAIELNEALQDDEITAIENEEVATQTQRLALRPQPSLIRSWEPTPSRSPRLAPSPARVIQQNDPLNTAVRCGLLLESLSDSMLLFAFATAPSEEALEEAALARMIVALAMGLMIAEMVMAKNRYSPAAQPRANNGLYPAPVLSRPRPRPVPPNPQQLFAQNYYRPAAPRPLPVAALAPRNEQRLNAVHFPDDLIPEAFKCELLSTVMDNPVRLPLTKQVCDGVAVLQALARKPENPFNRQPMKMEDAKAELELKTKISRYTDYVVDAVQQKQKASGQQTLARADYEAIHQAAMNRLEPHNQLAAPAPKRAR